LLMGGRPRHFVNGFGAPFGTNGWDQGRWHPVKMTRFGAQDNRISEETRFG
jgi:hypothetical protein